jgi:hypothetical protein
MILTVLFFLSEVDALDFLDGLTNRQRQLMIIQLNCTSLAINMPANNAMTADYVNSELDMIAMWADIVELPAIRERLGQVFESVRDLTRGGSWRDWSETLYTVPPLRCDDSR